MTTVILCIYTWVGACVRTHAGGAGGGAATSRPCDSVACLSLPEVNNVFFHLTLESNEIIRGERVISHRNYDLLDCRRHHKEVRQKRK